MTSGFHVCALPPMWFIGFRRRIETRPDCGDDLCHRPDTICFQSHETDYLHCLDDPEFEETRKVGQMIDEFLTRDALTTHSAEVTSASIRLRSRIVTLRSSISIMPSAWRRLRLRDTNSRTVPICDAIS